MVLLPKVFDSGVYLLFAFFEKAGIITGMIHVIVALVGRFSGEAGYMTLRFSAAMGSPSGTGLGNAAAIGVVMILAMKTGYPSALSVAAEAAASALRPDILTSGATVILFAALDAFGWGG